MNRKVQLYVGTTSYQNVTTSVINTFFTNVTANGGICESGQYAIDYLNSLGGIYGNLSTAERLELFEDEQIQVTSTVQNVQDISKTFTDFSQSFTIPANDHNNRILQHFYQSDVNALIDYNIRLDSFIEIELSFFRRGKLQVEKANLKNGMPESYTVTFYGDGRTLKDYFGEDLLSDLDYTALTHDFTSEEVIFRIEDNTNYFDVKYPLITSNRIWEYQSTPVNLPFPNWLVNTITQNDIHSTAGAVYKEELFPAVRVKKIFEFIESKYGITFNGTFLDDERFTKLFLWFKGAQTLQTASNSIDVDFTSIGAVSTPPMANYIDLANNSIIIADLPTASLHRVSLIVNTLSTGSFYLDIYQNGNLFNSILIDSTGTFPISQVQQTSGINIVYTYQVRNLAALTADLTFLYEIDYIVSGTLLTAYANAECGSVAYNMTLNISANAPQMKVSDFFAGILKVFNMVCVGNGENVYDIAPLDTWYGQGAIVDISKYTDIQSIDVQRMPLYKKISFKFQDSECFINKNFAQTYNRNYGDTTYQYNYDGGEFTVDVPFENLMQTKFNGTQELQLGYSLNSEYTPYLPKPVLLYQYDNKVTDFKFLEDTGSHATITDYTPFGQDLRYNNTDLTLNYSAETSTLLEIPIQQTLFAQYYFSYLYNLYNLKQRLVSVKTKLPIGLLTGIKLNDRLIIRDKRYIINDMKSNLTTGEVDFQLYLDFRPMINTVPYYIIPSTGGSAVTAINLPNGAVSALLVPSSSDLTLSQTTITQSTNVTATLPATTSGNVYTIDITFYNVDASRTAETINIVVQ